MFNWSGLPVVHVRPTVFLDTGLFTTLAAHSIADSGTIRLPFGTGRTSPIASDDVARVVATILTDPGPYIGRVLELTGPRSQDMNGIAEEYARALGRPVSYVDVPWETWAAQVLAHANLGPYVEEHIATMARLHRENRYDRVTDTVEEDHRPTAESVEEFVARRRTCSRRDLALPPAPSAWSGRGFHPPCSGAARSTASRTSCSAVSSAVSADVSNHHPTSPRSRFMSASSS